MSSGHSLRAKGGKARIEQIWLGLTPKRFCNELCGRIVRSNSSKLPTTGDPRITSQQPLLVTALCPDTTTLADQFLQGKALCTASHTNDDAVLFR
jgi:hypothetical protein